MTLHISFNRAWAELVALKDHEEEASMDAAQSLAANKLADFLDPAHVALVPLMQQLLVAENCLQPDE